VLTFIGHLLALTKKNSDGDSVKHEEGPDGKKEKEKQAFLKSYGGHRSALTFLFNECEITPSVQFQTKMSKAMAGLKKIQLQSAEAKMGASLERGNCRFRLMCTVPSAKALAKDKDTSAVLPTAF
jgi:hypothetical protein